MNRLCRNFFGALTWVAFCAAAWQLADQSTSAAEVLLKDGRILQGRLGEVAGLAEVPQAPDPQGIGPIQSILLVDDDLRRTFVSKRQIREIRQDAAAPAEE